MYVLEKYILQWYVLFTGIKSTLLLYFVGTSEFESLVSSWRSLFAKLKFFDPKGGLIGIFSDRFELSPFSQAPSENSSDQKVDIESSPSDSFSSQTLKDVKIFILSWNMGAKDLFPGRN